MSQENVELVQRTYEAIRRRDVEGCLRELHPEVQGTAFLMSLEDEVFHGHEGFRRFLERLFEVFPDWAPEITEALAHNDMVLVAIRVSAHGAASGVPLNWTYWQVARLRDGKVISWHGFGTRAEAVEALGLRA